MPRTDVGLRLMTAEICLITTSSCMRMCRRRWRPSRSSCSRRSRRRRRPSCTASSKRTGFRRRASPPRRVSSSRTSPRAAPSMKGGLALSQLIPWTATSNASVAQYLTATNAAGTDSANINVEWDYSMMLWLYGAANAAGFSHLTGTTLQTSCGRRTTCRSRWRESGSILALRRRRDPTAARLSHLLHREDLRPASGGSGQRWLDQCLSSLK